LCVQGGEVAGGKPHVLWSLYFNYPATSDHGLTADIPANVYLCSGPDLDLDFEYAVNQVNCVMELLAVHSIIYPSFISFSYSIVFYLIVCE
jgi:hypothetical protein